MSYYVNKNVSMKVSRDNSKILEKINESVSFISEANALEDLTFSSKYDMDDDCFEISYQFSGKVKEYALDLQEKCGKLVEEAEDGSYIIETGTGDFGVYYNLYGDIKETEKELSEITEPAEWYRNNELFLCVSAPSGVEVGGLAEELKAAWLCYDIEDSYDDGEGTTYHLCGMPMWRCLNQKIIAGLKRLLNVANEKAAEFGAKITIVDEGAVNEPEEFLGNFEKNELMFIAKDCTSALVLTTDENGIADVKVIAFEK